MRSLRWLVLSGLCCAACQRDPAPSDDAEDQRRQAELQAEIEATHARYRSVLEAFLSALAARQPATAYALLAPVYQNMVSEASFARRIVDNRNFAQAPTVKVLSTSSTAGTTKVRAVLGGLGLAEATFAEGPAGPRLSSLSLAGASALPPPE